MVTKWPKQVRDNGRSAIDWSICLVRWGLLVGLVVWSLFDPARYLSLSHLALFSLAFGAYNLTISVLLTVGWLTRAIPQFTLLADTAAVLAVVSLSGGVAGPFFFLPLFPLLVAVLRFGWEIGLLIAGLFFVSLGLQATLAWRADPGPAPLFPVVGQGVMLVAAVAAVSILRKQNAWLAASEKTRQAEERLTIPDQVKMVYDMAATLSATLNYQRVLEAILDVSRLEFDELDQRRAESAGLVFLFDRNGMLHPASYRNLMFKEDETRRIRGRAGIVGQAIASAQAVIGGEPASDPELNVFRSLERFKSMICVPLRAGFETYGAVLFASVQADAYTSKHLDLLMIFCNQATIALQNASLYQKLREERDKIIDKEEQARHKLARDLHDGPTQDIAAIAMRLNFARLLVEKDPMRARTELARLEDLAHRTVREIRSMLFTLRPVILEAEGLVAALNQYAENLRDNDGIPIEVDVEQYRDCLDIEAQGVIFAIIEEAVHNAQKHAQASHIRVRLAVQDDVLVAQVTDDGRGFDLQALEREYGTRGNLGLVNLRERAELLGGTLNIDSAPGQGTRVTLIVPLDEK